MKQIQDDPDARGKKQQTVLTAFCNTVIVGQDFDYSLNVKIYVISKIYFKIM